MFEAVSRSWQITKLSFSVINKDKELLLFPILAGIFSTIFMVLLAIPSLLPAIIAGSGLENISEIALYGLMFVIYLGLSFIATFFNVCIVYTTKIRFEGGNATFGESLSFAFSKIHLIFAWSMLSATVGILLRILDSIAERLGFIGEIILKIVISLIGLVWSIAIIFVVPGMVYDDLGPIEAIKHSVNVLKKTWGENLIKHFGLGLIQFLFMLLGVIIFVPLAILASTIAMVGTYAMILIAVLAVLYFLALTLVFSLAKGIFNTALYVYASTGMVPSGYNQEILQKTFRLKQ